MVGVTSFLAVNIKGMFRIDCEAAFEVVFHLQLPNIFWHKLWHETSQITLS
jgi:hypothetical protein